MVGCTLLLWLQPSVEVMVGMAAAWLFSIVGVAFEVRNRRGAWSAHGRSTRAFLELAELQIERTLRSYRFNWGLMAAQAVFFVPWIAWIVSRGPQPRTIGAYAGPYLFFVAVVAAVAGSQWWFRRRALRRLTHVRALRRAYGEEIEVP